MRTDSNKYAWLEAGDMACGPSIAARDAGSVFVVPGEGCYGPGHHAEFMSLTIPLASEIAWFEDRLVEGGEEASKRVRRSAGLRQLRV